MPVLIIVVRNLEMKTNAIGLMHGVIRLDLYNPVWSECFQLEAKRLRKKLRQRVSQIEHIGSTAIPEMIAKPIVDLMASVDDLEEARSLISDIETLGYTYGENDEISEKNWQYFGNEEDWPPWDSGKPWT